MSKIIIFLTFFFRETNQKAKSFLRECKIDRPIKGEEILEVYQLIGHHRRHFKIEEHYSQITLNRPGTNWTEIKKKTFESPRRFYKRPYTFASRTVPLKFWYILSRKRIPVHSGQNVYFFIFDQGRESSVRTVNFTGIVHFPGPYTFHSRKIDL